MDDERDDETQDDERRPEDPNGLSDAAARDVYGVGCLESAKHGDCISANRDVLAQMRGAEEVDHIVADGGIVVSADAAEEDNDVVLRLVRDVHVSEEDDNIVIDVSLGIHAAEEADCVVNGLAFADDDVAAELYGIFFGAGRGCDEHESRREQDCREQALSHVDPHAELYAEEGDLVPGAGEREGEVGRAPVVWRLFLVRFLCVVDI